ncbi:hypothetical protein OESDEN_11544 [Oesophagostomum dentatum]|uniref:Uncharacterized protein n=1 Tax=Oesophagostomum dentatum TaxID=61180 RepID=A0A0B1SZU8_OESDE|nr:hypothetical protein OESDEN_11544 [Oesophagostomum dentatum]
MNRLLVLVVLCLAALLSVDAQKREKVERVPLSFRGDVCDKICSKRDGWERCEKVQKRNEYEVTCTDLSRERGPGGRGSGGPFGGGRGSGGSFGRGPFGRK